MKKIALFLALFSLNAALWAQDLVIGTIDYNPPFSYQTQLNGPLSGFDVDIMNRICEKINRTCVFKLFTYVQLYPELKQGTIDLAIGSLVLTGQKNDQIIFSLPYKMNALQFVTLASSKISTVYDLRNKLIGVYQSAPDEGYVNQLLSGQVQFKTYAHVNDLMNALEDKNLDAVAIAYHRAIYWLSNSQEFKLVGSRFHIGQGYGIAARASESKLIDQINTAITEIERDGTYLQIYQLYF